MARLWLFSAVFVCAPGAAMANIGLPMIVVTTPWMVICLIPVVAMEAWVLVRQLQVSARSAAVSSAIANLLTTFVGVPITWGLLVLLQLSTGGGGIPYDFSTPLGKFLSVTWQAPWLLPFESDLGWMIPAAMATLFVPFFLASWWLETKVIWRRHRPEAFSLAPDSTVAKGSNLEDQARRLVSHVVRNANALTYCVMLIGLVLLELITYRLNSG